MSLEEIADKEQRTISEYYLSRDEEEVNESDELLVECSKLLDDEIAHNERTDESNKIKQLLQSGHSLKFITPNELFGLFGVRWTRVHQRVAKWLS